MQYLRIFYRKFGRSKGVYLINLLGLSGGMVCGLLIYLWIYDEMHIDRFYANSDRLYSVMMNDREADRVITSANGSIILGKALAIAFPEVEYAVTTTPVEWFRSFSISFAGGEAVKGKGNFAGKDFFHVFPRKAVAGDVGSALADPHSIAISASLARNLFHVPDAAIGKVVTWKWNALSREATVSAVYEDLPANSTTQLDFVVPIASWDEIIHADESKADLSGGPFNTFVVLRAGARPEDLNRKISGFIKEKIPASNTDLFVTKFSDGYLHGKYVNGHQRGGRIVFVRLFGIIAICVLLIACINFVNLSTAKASERMKEIGIKKTLGASRSSLIRQFLGESILQTCIALVIAMVVVVFLYPVFQDLTGKQFILVSDGWFIGAVLFFTLLTGVLAGIYPAFYLSGFQPVNVFRGNSIGSAAGVSMRKLLVVFQFSTSVVFIIVVMVVYNQVKFTLTDSPGYQKDNVIYFEMQGQVAKNADAFVNGIKKIPGIIEAGAIGNTIVIPSGIPRPGVYWDGKNADDKIRFEQMAVSYDALETLGVSLDEGRSFSRNFSDSNSIILNETAVRTMGLTNPLGKKVRIWDRERTVIGVVKDFHFNSFHDAILPFIFRMEPDACLMMMVRLSGSHQSNTLRSLATYYKQYNPGIYFDYRSLDDDYQQQYASDRLVATLCQYFAGLTILISCLGLLGLTAFAVERRVKEIGIRRVLGATHRSIVYLLSADFAKIVVVSVMIGLPISYLIMDRWLNDFAYRIQLRPHYFVVGAFATLLIAGMTIGIQSIRASLAKPQESLRRS